MHKLVALMPMKAHSERVKNKNFKLLNDKPLFRWMFDTLSEVDDIEQIVINTDAADQILSSGIADHEKLVIRERKKELCGDMVSMNLILEDDLANTDAGLYLMTHTTNPLISKSTIDQAISRYRENMDSYDSLFSVNRFQTRFYDGEGRPINHDPDNLIRTQDLEPWYEENSCLYLFTKTSFARTKARIGSKPLLFETPVMESIDIDDQEDWNLVEAILSWKHNE